MKNIITQWFTFTDKLPNEGERIIIAEDGHGAYDTYFSFDKEADYTNSIWCLWPF